MEDLALKKALVERDLETLHKSVQDLIQAMTTTPRRGRPPKPIGGIMEALQTKKRRGRPPGAMSPEARKRMSERMAARWAAKKAEAAAKAAPKRKQKTATE